MEPTERQIQQTERLQAKGLCQDSEEWIINELGAVFKIVNKSELSSLNPMDNDIYGPLPTFEEVWPELQKSMLHYAEKHDPKWGEVWFQCYSAGNFRLVTNGGILIHAELPEDPLGAAIEALLYLSEIK